MYRCVQLSAIQTSSIDTRHKTPKSVLGISYTCHFPLFPLDSGTNEQTQISPKRLYIHKNTSMSLHTKCWLVEFREKGIRDDFCVCDMVHFQPMLISSDVSTIAKNP